MKIKKPEMIVLVFQRILKDVAVWVYFHTTPFYYVNVLTGGEKINQRSNF